MTNVEIQNEYEYTTFPRQFVRYRWFKPILVTLLTTVFYFTIIISVMLVAYFMSGCSGITAFMGQYDYFSDGEGMFTAVGALINMGSIAAMIPALALAALIIRDRPYSSYSSSRGGFKWSAFFKGLIVAAVIMGIFFTIDTIFFNDDPGNGEISFTTAGFIVMVVLLPFQCAAEEYVFRGLLMQTLGSWIRVPVIAIILQAIVFALGHMYNIWGIMAIFVSGLAFGVIAWQTKGLEIGVAMHVVNNYIAFLSQGFGISGGGSEAGVSSMLISIVVDIVSVAVIIFITKKFHWFTPRPIKGELKM